VVQIAVHQLVPKTNQKKLRRGKKRVQSSGRWRWLRFGGNVTTENKTYRRLAGYVFQRVQITTRKNYDRKKRYSRVVWPAIFSGGFKLQPEKITTGKIKGTVIWPMEAAQIWQECNDREKNVQSSGRLCFSAGSNYNRKKLRPEKKNVQSSGRQLETGKITTGKKGTVISSCRLEGKTQNITHIIDTTTNKMSHATLPSSSFAPSRSTPWL
jgi:hypothetical protein